MKKLLISIMASIPLIACNPTKNTPTQLLSTEQIKTQLLKQIPELHKIDQVHPTQINGLYEVVVGRKIFYVSTDGKFVIFGNMVDLANKQSITEQHMQELAKIDFSKLPLNLAITHTIGNGSRKIAVFTDPDCPYCKLFEKQIVPQLKDVTIYNFLFPLPMHPNALTHSKQIWCSPNRSATWHNWMQKDLALPSKTDCDTSALDALTRVGTTLVQIDGTPTIILANGQILPGVLPADKLNAKLDQLSAKSTFTNPSASSSK